MKILITTLIAMLLTVGFAVADNDDATIKYQGKLMDGTNLFNGSATLVFRIYTNSVLGEYVYEESNTVVVVDGFYTILLGKHANYGQLKKAIKLAGAHIQVFVNGTPLWPREPFCPPPFASESTEHWTLFGRTPHAEVFNISTYNSYIADGSLFRYTIGQGVVGSYYDINLPAQYVRPCIFPPQYVNKEITGIRFFSQSVITNYAQTNLPIVTVRVRDMATCAEIRTLADRINISQVQGGEWFDIPLTDSLEARTLVSGEILEVLFAPEPPDGGAPLRMDNVFLDVTAQ